MAMSTPRYMKAVISQLQGSYFDILLQLGGSAGGCDTQIWPSGGATVQQVCQQGCVTGCMDTKLPSFFLDECIFLRQHAQVQGRILNKFHNNFDSKNFHLSYNLYWATNDLITSLQVRFVSMCYSKWSGTLRCIELNVENVDAEPITDGPVSGPVVANLSPAFGAISLEQSWRL